MAFNPYGTIYLCNVPFDSTYKNVVYFDSATNQRNYFTQKTLKTFTNFVTVRETLPDGTLRSYVKVPMNIDDLRALNVNYMYYQNSHSTTKYFYCFIHQLIYVNEDTTKIVFDTDVYQTWLFDTEILDSYVEREHSETDAVGDNVVPENFTMGNYDFVELYTVDIMNPSSAGYLVGCSNHLETSDTIARGRKMSGIYQGLYFYYFTEIATLNSFLDSIEEEEADCVQFIAYIPKFILGLSEIGDDGYVSSTTIPNSQSIHIEKDHTTYRFGSYKPSNNKLYTAPFFKLYLTNHNGGDAEYNLEEFADASNLYFTLEGDISANPSVCLYPLEYKSIPINYDAGVNITHFPQCSSNTDSYKLWLAKNQYGTAVNVGSNLAILAMLAGTAFVGPASLGIGAATVGAVGAGAASALPGLGASSLVAGATAAHSASSVLNSFNEVYRASREPNKVNAGDTSVNLLTAIGKNCYDFYYKRIKEAQAISIDNFFTMYGYQTNRLKKPNLSSRPYFNYVKTIGVNIIGGIPADDMVILKNIYDNGVTLWKQSATVGDYSVDNSPS